MDRFGTVYVADTVNYTIRKITPDGVVSTLVGLAGHSESVDGTGSAARFTDPAGLAVDTAGNRYVTDVHCLRKVTPDGVVTTLAGQAGSSRTFVYSDGVAVDAAGNVFVADFLTCVIDRVTPDGQVSPFAGSPGMHGSADGTGESARFGVPEAVTLDGAGNLFVTDVEGVYVFELRAHDAAGRLGIRRLTLMASAVERPPVSVKGHDIQTFAITVPSVVGYQYILEVAPKANAQADGWMSVPLVAGTGGLINLPAPAMVLYPGEKSFFRVFVMPP